MNSLPPGPKGSPLRGVLPRLSEDWLGGLAEYQRDHGDLVWLPMPPRLPPILLVGNPDLIEQVLVRDAARFRKSALQRRVRLAMGNGLFTSDGERWRRQRRLLQPHFQPSRVAAYGEEMRTCALRLRAALSAGGEHDVFALALDLALRVVVRALFGLSLEQVSAEVGQAFRALSDSLQRWLSSDAPLPASVVIGELAPARAAVRRLDDLVYRMIAQRRAGSAGDDLLSLLVRSRDAEGGSMSDGDLRDEILTMLVAGSETVALALAWGLYLLALHKEAAARLRAEVAALAGEPGVDTPLPYTEQVVHEALRLYPPTWAFSHAPYQDWSIGGYHVPRDTTVLMSPYLLHRDPRFFSEPLRFLPERWDASAPAPPRYAYLPFGGGPRACLGMRFALLELRLVLATVLPGVALSPIPERPPRALPHFTLRPEAGVWLRSDPVAP